MATFKASFAAARKAGKKEFSWNGKRYNTKLKEETKDKPKAKGPARPKARPTAAPKTSPKPQARKKAKPMQGPKKPSSSPDLRRKGISPTRSRIGKNIAKFFGRG